MTMLLEIASPAVDIDLRYATADNLAGYPLYRRPLCLLLPEAAAALDRAVALARGMGLRLRIFDAFRPVEAQWMLWHACPNPEFVADPREGSSHCRGAAVDLTLADAQGNPLPMGTGFDAVTPLSHHGVTDVPVEAQRNRALLLGIMVAAGWEHYPQEWWHYNLPDSARYPMLWDSATGGRMMGA